MTFLDRIAEFAQTGAVGPLRCNAALPDIAAVLGPPTDAGRVSKSRRWPHWFRYGSVQLEVCRCRQVRSVVIPTGPATIELPAAHSAEIVCYPSQTTYAHITAALDTLGCTWTTPAQQIPGQLTLHTAPEGATVSLSFAAPETAEGHARENAPLAKALAWTPAHTCPPPAPGQADDGYGN